MHTDEIIDQIRTHPGMYLGSMSLSKMEAFLSGYCCALRMNGLSAEETSSAVFPLPFSFFNRFICHFYGDYRNMGWCRHILQRCENDERKGLERFYALLDAYRSITFTECWRATLTEENIKTIHARCERVDEYNRDNPDYRPDGIYYFTDHDRLSNGVHVPRDTQRFYVFSLSVGNADLLAAESDSVLQLTWRDTANGDETRAKLAQLCGNLTWETVADGIIDNELSVSGRTMQGGH